MFRNLVSGVVALTLLLTVASLPAQEPRECHGRPLDSQMLPDTATTCTYNAECAIVYVEGCCDYTPVAVNIESEACVERWGPGAGCEMVCQPYDFPSNITARCDSNTCQLAEVETARHGYPIPSVSGGWAQGCPIATSLVTESGVISVDNRGVETQRSPEEFVAWAASLPDSCDQIAIWRDGDIEGNQARIEALRPALAAFGRTPTFNTFSGSDHAAPKLQAIEGESDYQLMEVRVPLAEVEIDCTETNTGPGPDQVPPTPSAEALLDVRLRVRIDYSMGTMSVRVPWPMEPPANPDPSGPCSARWGSAPALAMVPVTLLPIVTSGDDVHTMEPLPLP